MEQRRKDTIEAIHRRTIARKKTDTNNANSAQVTPVNKSTPLGSAKEFTSPPDVKKKKQAPSSELVDGFERTIISLEFQIEKGEVS